MTETIKVAPPLRINLQNYLAEKYYSANPFTNPRAAILLSDIAG